METWLLISSSIMIGAIVGYVIGLFIFLVQRTRIRSKSLTIIKKQHEKGMKYFNDGEEILFGEDEKKAIPDEKVPKPLPVKKEVKKKVKKKDGKKKSK